MKIVYLKPLSGYATPLRSDTLWGMLCWGIRYLWGESELTKFLLDCQNGKPPFFISSAFPYKQYGKEYIPFFPNPLLFPDQHHDDREKALQNARLRKDYKKQFRYVNLTDFTEILQGKLSAHDLRDRMLGKSPVPFEVAISRTAPHLEDFSMTHNTIDRLRGGTLNILDEAGNASGQLFHSPEHYWIDNYADPNQESNTGIFFLADGPNLSQLEPVLRLFRHWGFGADRTSGKGFFDIDIQELDLPEPTDANAMLNLSLFRPTPEELTMLDGEDADNRRFQYRIELRGGQVGDHHRDQPKQAHRYFSEGSVFPLLPALASRHLGGLVHQFDQPHPVWDNGFGFMLHLKWP